MMEVKTSENNARWDIPLTILITILIALVPAVMAYGKLTERVETLDEEIHEKTETIISLQDRLIILEKIAAGTEVSLSSIQSDIGEIKIDLREHIRETTLFEERR